MPFTLPDLPFAKEALTPHMSAETLDFHHGKHHQAYVDKLNELVGQTERTAQLRLAQDGFDLGTVSEIRSEGLASDVVAAQDPPASAAGAARGEHWGRRGAGTSRRAASGARHPGGRAGPAGNATS